MSGAWSDRTDWLLPFDLRRRRLLGRWGRCCQAEGGTHVDELQHAVDYSVDERTPVIASRDGVVAAAVGDFKAARSRRFEMVRKLEPRLRTRSNYVALRHADAGGGSVCYSRYYHLRSVAVAAGQKVRAGELLGYSGNTGYSSGPHLHFDVADVIPTDAARLTLVPGAHAEPSAARPEAATLAAGVAPILTDGGVALGCSVGSFSGPMPPASAPLRARPVWGEPRTAIGALTNADEARGAIVLLERCKDVDFIDKARRAEEAGAAAVIIVNYEDDGPVLLCMGAPRQPVQSGTPTGSASDVPSAEPGATKPGGSAVRIPALLVTHAAGVALDAASRLDPIQLHVAATEHYRAPPRPPWHAGSGARPVASSPFVARTLPVRFACPGRDAGYVPRAGWLPPAASRRAARAAAARALPAP